MVDLRTFVLVYLIDNLKVGDQFVRSRLTWPLHITVIPWFQTNKANATGLIKVFQQYLNTIDTFDVTIGPRANFGAKNQIPVSLIEGSLTILNQMHQSLLERLQSVNGQIDTSRQIYVGEKYRPHVTHHGTRMPNQDNTMHIDNLALVEATSDRTCTINHLFKLGNPS
ncbi:MAG: hypothetical protein NVSMB37_6420 [Candidatus Saccharimonadales bacterium]